MKSRRSRFAQTVLLTSLLGAAATSWAVCARAESRRTKERRACASSYESSQEQQTAGKLRGARATLLACARPACGEYIHRECSRALARIESEIPTVVPQAKNHDGKPVVDVEVTMDGEPISSNLDGRAVAVDPGVHEFAFKSPDGAIGLLRLPISQGEHNRVLSADLVSVAGSPGPSRAPTTIAATPATPATAALVSPSATAERGASIGPYVVGGVGVAGVAGFAVLYAIARNDNKGLTQCWPTCSDSQLNAVSRDYLAADVSLGVALAALGTAAVWLYLDSKSARKEAAPSAPRYAFDLKPSSSRLLATVSGSF